MITDDSALPTIDEAMSLEDITLDVQCSVFHSMSNPKLSERSSIHHQIREKLKYFIASRAYFY